MKLRAMQVKEVNDYIKRLLEFDPILNQVFVVGELSNYKKHSSGHHYFTLKDSHAKISCVMFKSAAYKLDFDPLDGEKVEIRGRIGVYERDGRYQIYVDSMKPLGAGDLFKAFLKLKNELDLKGYYEKELPIIPLPRKIGIVTSPTGAAIQDMLKVLKRRNPLTEIIIYPARVQGQLAPLEIARGIDFFNENPVDTIIIGRGGGSLEELWAFNELMVAEAIFHSKIPIISGVGHETDFTISDFVADLRAATPTEAAELSVVPIDYYQRKISDLGQNLKKHMSHQRQLLALRLDYVNDLELCKLIRQNMDSVKNQLISLNSDSVNHMKNRLINRQKDLTHLGVLLNSVSPLNILDRGYAIAEKNHQIITSIDSVDLADRIDIFLKNGIIRTKVISKERNELIDE